MPDAAAHPLLLLVCRHRPEATRVKNPAYPCAAGADALGKCPLRETSCLNLAGLTAPIASAST